MRIILLNTKQNRHLEELDNLDKIDILLIELRE